MVRPTSCIVEGGIPNPEDTYLPTCLGVPRAQGGIFLMTNASNVGGGGTLFQWQALEKEEFDSAISQWGTEGLNQD